MDRDFSKYRKNLLAITQRLAADATALTDEVLTPSGGQTAGEVSNMPTHLGDRGTEEYLSELNSTLLENEEYLVREARAAIERMDNGTYGRCESCGQEIAEERLMAMPYCRFCIRCAESQEEGASPNLNEGRGGRL
jgi:DnaK suppressor protein